MAVAHRRPAPSLSVLSFHVLSFLVILATMFWLWRQGRERSRLAYALYALLFFELLRGGLAYAGLLANRPLLIAGHLLAWGVLLWGMKLAAPWIIACLSGAFILAWLPFLPAGELLSWGFITAVPLAAVAVLRQRPNVPIIAPVAPAAHLRPVSTRGLITAEMIESQEPILECLADGVVFSGHSGLVMYANQAAAAILGQPTGEIVGRPIENLLTHYPMLAPSGQPGAFSRFELNGRTIQGQMSIIYNKEGAAQGTVVILHDITAEYRAEQARDTFLTTVSHELRTPLTAIKGYVELLSGGVAGDLSEKQLTFLTTIQRNANRMVHLINSLIFAATIKGGRLEYVPGHADLPQLIQQIVREMTPAAAKDQQVIQTDIDSRLRLVQADPIHMATILEELVNNSIKYNRAGGIVRISANLETDASQQQEFAVISVRDEGIGIEPADQAHIFGEFYRPEWREEQIRTGGIGMGLSIVRALVEAYNGRIWFESAPAHGSSFTFIIPTRQPDHLSALSP